MKTKDSSDEIHSRCVESYAGKPAQWLLSLDGFNDKCFSYDKTKAEPEPDFYLHTGYELAIAAWNARMYITPNTSRKEAITLAEGFIRWLDKTSDKEFENHLNPNAKSLYKVQAYHGPGREFAQEEAL